jgi:hypothetical protein
MRMVQKASKKEGSNSSVFRSMLDIFVYIWPERNPDPVSCHIKLHKATLLERYLDHSTHTQGVPSTEAADTTTPLDLACPMSTDHDRGSSVEPAVLL